MALKIAILGAGKMGLSRGQTLRGVNSVSAPKEAIGEIGFYDPLADNARMAEVLGKVTGSKRYDSLESAVEDADVIDIAVPNDKVTEVILEAAKYAKQGAFLTAETSEKSEEAEAFAKALRQYSGKSLLHVGIHHMCN